jgi:hypothetical protein
MPVGPLLGSHATEITPPFASSAGPISSEMVAPGTALLADQLVPLKAEYQMWNGLDWPCQVA